MLISNAYLMIFALAMMGCVLATPLVTQFANWVGAIDRPDQFRRIHHGAIPRLGGLALATGVIAGLVLSHLTGWSWALRGTPPNLAQGGALLIAALVILAVGFVDDTRSIGPRVKLLGQALAVLALYLGGIRIQSIDVLSLEIDLGSPSIAAEVLGQTIDLAFPSLLVTLFWFLGCMNVWNLIDGMDGLASGVGLLVSGTLTLLAIHNENIEMAILGVALAGSLAGFLLYNWHPACIFLGDSGSLLIGLLIGVIGVQGSMKGPSAISILFPILAMGLPISDTAMAIFRRWVRNLPLSAADRRHVHHLLMGLGLNPRQAALLLYCFSGFLCGAVMLGVALRSEFLALTLGISGCLAFLLVVTSRRDELTTLREDFQARMVRGRQERQAARVTWEAIQRIELCASPTAALEVMVRTAVLLGCKEVQVSEREPRKVARDAHPARNRRQLRNPENDPLSGPDALFRLPLGMGLRMTCRVALGREPEPPADIVIRYLERLRQALTARLAALRSEEAEAAPSAEETPGSVRTEGSGVRPASEPQDWVEGVPTARRVPRILRASAQGLPEACRSRAPGPVSASPGLTGR